MVSVVLLFTSNALAQINAVYIENNVGQVPLQDSILAFANDGTGALTPIQGKFLTNGTGVFATPKVDSPGLTAENEIVVNSAGTLLLAVNGGSNTISVFSIASTGALKLLSTTPYDSLGSDPVSIGLDETSPAGPYVVVANAAADPSQPGFTPGIQGFFLDESTGILTPANSSFNYGGLSPSQAVAAPSGRFEFVLGGGNLCSYSVGNAGLLVINNCFAPNVGTIFLGAVTHPKQRVIYAGQPGAHLLSVFTYSKAGNLAFQRDVANQGSLVCWLTTNKAGTRLYTSESGTTGTAGTVTVYDISGANFLKPVQLQHFTLTANGANIANLKLDPTEQFLYVLAVNESGTAANYLHVVAVASDGTLTETAAPLKLNIPTGEIPQGLAVAMR
jgi:6-phosphogluconolactonase (cycloisomerase 2 family)